MSESLIQNSNVIDIQSVIDSISSAGVFIATLGLLFATWKILKANQKSVLAMQDQIESTNRPYVDINIILRPGYQTFYLCIENPGKSPARNLELILDKDYEITSLQSKFLLSSYPLFAKKDSFLFPRAKIKYYLDDAISVFSDSKQPKQFTITARYTGLDKEFTDTHIIDLDLFQNMVQENVPSIEKIEKAFDKGSLKIKIIE